MEVEETDFDFANVDFMPGDIGDDDTMFPLLEAFVNHSEFDQRNAALLDLDRDETSDDPASARSEFFDWAAASPDDVAPMQLQYYQSTQHMNAPASPSDERDFSAYVDVALRQGKANFVAIAWTALGADAQTRLSLDELVRTCILERFVFWPLMIKFLPVDALKEWFPRRPSLFTTEELIQLFAHVLERTTVQEMQAAWEARQALFPHEQDVVLRQMAVLSWLVSKASIFGTEQYRTELRALLLSFFGYPTGAEVLHVFLETFINRSDDECPWRPLVALRVAMLISKNQIVSDLFRRLRALPTMAALTRICQRMPQSLPARTPVASTIKDALLEWQSQLHGSKDAEERWEYVRNYFNVNSLQQRSPVVRRAEKPNPIGVANAYQKVRNLMASMGEWFDLTVAQLSAGSPPVSLVFTIQDEEFSCALEFSHQLQGGGVLIVKSATISNEPIARRATLNFFAVLEQAVTRSAGRVMHSIILESSCHASLHNVASARRNWSRRSLEHLTHEFVAPLASFTRVMQAGSSLTPEQFSDACFLNSFLTPEQIVQMEAGSVNLKHLQCQLEARHSISSVRSQHHLVTLGNRDDVKAGPRLIHVLELPEDKRLRSRVVAFVINLSSVWAREVLFDFGVENSFSRVSFWRESGLSEPFPSTNKIVIGSVKYRLWTPPVGLRRSSGDPRFEPAESRHSFLSYPTLQKDKRLPPRDSTPALPNGRYGQRPETCFATRLQPSDARK